VGLHAIVYNLFTLTLAVHRIDAVASQPVGITLANLCGDLMVVVSKDRRIKGVADVWGGTDHKNRRFEEVSQSTSYISNSRGANISFVTAEFFTEESPSSEGSLSVGLDELADFFSVIESESVELKVGVGVGGNVGTASDPSGSP
jgi:hypothetical protein